MDTLLLEGDSLSYKKGAYSVELFQKHLQYQLQRGRLDFALTHLNQFISAQHDTRAKNLNSAPGLNLTVNLLI